MPAGVRAWRACCTALALLAGRAGGTYWGEGWEDPVLKQEIYRALKVVSNNSEIPNEDLNDNFDWLDYEDGGGVGKVVGSEGYTAEPLQSWEPRNDAVQHGYFMLYEMSDEVSELEKTMEEFFFSISIDVGTHTGYAAVGEQPNCTLRLMLIEAMPVDLGSNSDAQLVMKGGPIVYSQVLTNQVEDLQWDDQVELANHTLTWGFATKEDETLVCDVVKPPTSHLYVGIQCLRGWAVPESACTFNLLSAPSYDDCRSYCPFQLTVRAVPRAIGAGETVRSLLGPGEWQTFELTAGEYDLLQLTLGRREFDNGTYAHVLQDGFAGNLWLSRAACVEAEVSEVEVEGYCPHGGELTVNLTSGQDRQPHPLCSRDLNLTYDVDVDEASWVRALGVSPSSGTQDDLGWRAVQEEIAALTAEYEAEMHYPTQLELLEQLGALRDQAAALAFANASWQRSWSVRTCLSSATADGLDGPSLAGTYYATVYASHAMARKDAADAHNGEFTVTLTQQAFSRGELQSNQKRQGCLRRGTAELFAIPTHPAAPEQTSLGLARVRGVIIDDASNHASSLSVRRGAAPTVDAYDLRVEWPDLRAALSACDVAEAQTWHLRVALDDDADADEVFFEVEAELEDSVLQLGDAVSGFACCNVYRYYAFPAISEVEAPLVHFNLTAGEMKAVYWRYDGCPVEERDVVGEFCTGWCVISWLRRFSGNLGRADYEYDGTLAVPFGAGEDPDKRRGGTWYLALQALEGAAEYTLETETTAPEIHVKTGCSRLDRYCSQTFQDLGVQSSAPRSRGAAGLAAPGSVLALASALLLSRLSVARQLRAARSAARTSSTERNSDLHSRE